MDYYLEPVIRHERRYWYPVFDFSHLRRAERPPKDGRAHVVEALTHVSGVEYRHVLFSSVDLCTVEFITVGQSERETLVPVRVAELLGILDLVVTVDAAGVLVPVYREYSR